MALAGARRRNASVVSEKSTRCSGLVTAVVGVVAVGARCGKRRPRSEEEESAVTMGRGKNDGIAHAACEDMDARHASHGHSVNPAAHLRGRTRDCGVF